MIKRNRSLDIIKGIGIIFVFLGHNRTIGKEYISYIFSFHMPLFFFISGMLFKKTEGFLIFLRNKVKTLIVPYFSFWIIGYIFYGLELRYKGNFNLEKYIDYFINNILWGLKYKATGLWFLLVLFIVNIVFYIVLNKNDNKLRLMIKLLPFSFIGVLTQILGIHKGLFRWPTVFIAVTIFGVGYLLKEKIINHKFSLSQVLGLLIIGFLFYKINGHISMASNRYHNVVFFYISSISSILGLYGISSYIYKDSILEFVGKNSLIYFALCDGLIKRYVLIPLTKRGFFIQSENLFTGFIWVTFQIVIGSLVVLIINKYFPILVGKKKSGGLWNDFTKRSEESRSCK